MKETLEKIIRSLVDKQDEVSINEVSEENAIIYEVKVAESDMGRIIGKEGRISKAIRTIMKALAGKTSQKVLVKFIDR